MKIRYNSKLKLAGIGMIPWSRLGLERWFDDYKIVSIFNWDLSDVAGMPHVEALPANVKLPRKNAQQLVNSATFKKLATEDLVGYKFVTYKPLQIRSPKLQKRFISTHPNFIKTFENKAYIRKHFGKDLPFVPFKIYNRDRFTPTKVFYEQLQQFADPFVLQHEQLSDGKGTFLIRSFSDYRNALMHLPEGKIVVSHLIDGAKERSVQAVVTRHGIFTGPLQKQIIRDPLLCNLKRPQVKSFCGAEIGTIKPGATTRKVQKIAHEVGELMRQAGFKGIFGVDVLVKDGEVYLLEVNARITGVTGLLTALYREGKDIPFYLLHVLELSGSNYKLIGTSSPTVAIGGLMQLQNHNSSPVKLKAIPASGVYAYKKGTLTLLRRDIHFMDSDPKGAFIIQAYVPEGEVIKRGDRLLAVFTKQAILDKNDQLKNHYKQLVSALYSELQYSQPMKVKSAAETKIKAAAKGRLVVGAVEKVSFPEFKIRNVEAKVDTGAMSAALHTTNVYEERLPSGKKVLHFSPFEQPEVKVTTKKYYRRPIRSSNGHTEVRFIINTKIILKGKSYPIRASLADRSRMTYPALIGSNFLTEQKILVDLSKHSR